MEFREILGVDKNVSLEFFVSHLIEIVPEGSPTPAGRARADEIGFVASILADSTDTLATRGLEHRQTELWKLFEHYVLRQSALNNLSVLEYAATQGVIYNGFFRSQMMRRHDVEWFDELIRSFFWQARSLTLSSRKRSLYDRMSQNSRFWNVHVDLLHQKFADNPYLLRVH